MCRCPSFVEFPSVSWWGDHFFDTNFCFTPLIQAFRDTRYAERCPGQASQSIYMKKSCPACQGYPTCRGETTRPPGQSRPPRQLGVIHILYGCLNFTTTQGKVNSPRVTRGESCFGYPRLYINGALKVRLNYKTKLLYLD